MSRLAYLLKLCLYLLGLSFVYTETGPWTVGFLAVFVSLQELMGIMSVRTARRLDFVSRAFTALMSSFVTASELEKHWKEKK